MKRLSLFAATALVFAVPTVAGAQESGAQEYGYATGDVNLRSGPDIDYPVVSVIPEGSELEIQGCTEGWEWCDVIVGDDEEDRGWVAGNFIAYDYDDQPVLVSQYGERVGIPLVTFSVGNYWDSYYRNRPFYGDRYRWYNRPYVRHAAPRPFIGWNLRFGINGRDHDRWSHRGDHGWDHNGHDHGGWDRDHYYNHGSDRGHDHGHDNNWDHGHDRDHGRVVPMPHPTPDDHHARDDQHHSSYHPAAVVPKPNQGFGHNNPPPPAPKMAPPKGDHQGKGDNNKQDDSKKKDDKKDHQRQ